LRYSTITLNGIAIAPLRQQIEELDILLSPGPPSHRDETAAGRGMQDESAALPSRQPN